MAILAFAASAKDGQVSEDSVLVDKMTILTSFTTLAYLRDITLDYNATRTRGDPRRILHQMSLAAAMHHKIQTAPDTDLELRQLRVML